MKKKIAETAAKTKNLFGFNGKVNENLNAFEKKTKKKERKEIKKKKIEKGRRKRPAAPEARPCNGFFIYRLNESLLLLNI